MLLSGLLWSTSCWLHLARKQQLVFFNLPKMKISLDLQIHPWKCARQLKNFETVKSKCCLLRWLIRTSDRDVHLDKRTKLTKRKEKDTLCIIRTLTFGSYMYHICTTFSSSQKKLIDLVTDGGQHIVFSGGHLLQISSLDWQTPLVHRLWA